MSAMTTGRFRWTVVVPVVALVLLAATWGRHPGGAVEAVMLAVVGIVLVGAVLAAVHHAEVVAHRVGEPFGSLVLAVAVTVIEVALIVTLMVSTDKDTSALARDTVFAAVMITLNGIVGISLLVGALKHHLANFNPEGTGAALSTVIALASLTLVLPRLHDVRARSRVLRAAARLRGGRLARAVPMFVFTQTVRHRDFFLPVETGGGPVDADGDGHADPAAGQGRPDQPRPARRRHSWRWSA